MDNKNNMTIDDLAVMIKQEFNKVNKRFDKINERFDVIERSVDEIKMKMAYVAWQIDMNEVKERLLEVEKKVGIKK